MLAGSCISFVVLLSVIRSEALKLERSTGAEAYSCSRYSCIHLLNVGILDQPHRPHRHLLPERNLGNAFPATKDTLKLRPNLTPETGKRYLP
jgi:hypothetical protein